MHIYQALSLSLSLSLSPLEGYYALSPSLSMHIYQALSLSLPLFLSLSLYYYIDGVLTTAHVGNEGFSQNFFAFDISMYSHAEGCRGWKLK